MCPLRKRARRKRRMSRADRRGSQHRRSIEELDAPRRRRWRDRSRKRNGLPRRRRIGARRQAHRRTVLHHLRERTGGRGDLGGGALALAGGGGEREIGALELVGTLRACALAPGDDRAHRAGVLERARQRGRALLCGEQRDEPPPDLELGPGLIDVDVHVYDGVAPLGIPPDPNCVAKGVTTVLDAGSAGAHTFPGFRKYVIDVAQTRVRALLNISVVGQSTLSPDNPHGELLNLNYANPALAVRTIERHRDVIPNGERFDVVVLDPAKLTRDRDDVLGALKKYTDMNRLAMHAVKPGGVLLTCSCTGLVGEPDFLEMLRRAAWQAQRHLQIFKISGAGGDHPFFAHVPEGRYLKAVFCRVL